MPDDDPEDSLLPDVSNTDDVDSDDDEPDLTEGLSLAECVEKANAHKAEGNTHFVAKRSREALACYDKGVSFVSKHSLEPEARPLLIALHTNSAACHNRLGAGEEAAKASEEWKAAIKSANASLDIDYTDKAMFRRGVAHSRRGELDEAKTDLTAVCKGDPKNREAREELAAVAAALKERKQEERKAYGSMFSGPSMYREEEIRERRKKEEEEQKKAKEKAEEAKLREEWRDECDRLRAEGAEKRPKLADADVSGAAAAVDAAAPAPPEAPAEGVEAMTLDTPDATGSELPEAAAAADAGTATDAAAAKDSEEKADSDDDADEPISFVDFKKQKEAAKKEAEEEVKAAKEAALAERQRARAKTDVVRVDDDDELQGVIRGYKKRADGSTTSYFTREVDPATKALLDAQKAPKRLDPQQAAAAASGGAGAAGSAAADGALPDARKGSAWNAAGTWEEKDLSSWAQQRLKPRLAELKVSVAASTEEMEARITAATSDAASASDGDVSAMASALQDAVSPLLITVKDVKKCEGSASVQSSRGKTKHLYDLTFEIEWEGKLQADDEPAAAAIAAAVAAGTDDKGKEDKDKDKAKVACKGVLTYAEVTSSAASADEFEVEHRFKKAPAAKLKARADSGVALLRAEIVKTIEQFSKELRLKTISA